MRKQIEMPALTLAPQALVSEIRRELKMRAHVYPRWVKEGKRLSQSDADHRIRCMDQTLAVLEAVFADELRPAQADMLS